jgi:hypothetical protein
MNAPSAQSSSFAVDDNAAEKTPRWRRIGNVWGRAWRAALDVVFPPLCIGCQSRLRDHDALCSECWRQIDFIRPPLCDRLGLPMPYDTGAPMISAAAAAPTRRPSSAPAPLPAMTA